MSGTSTILYKVNQKPAMELSLELYRKMYLVRAAEQKICDHYYENQMKTPVHMSIGAEAIAAGVCHALSPDHQALGTYRSHGIYLAMTKETDRFFAELYGKQTGLANGVAGSMHLSAPEYGLLGSSAIVAGSIPIATGAAFANKRAGNGKIVAVFFGDGAVDEGVFWESLNAACVMQLPVLFICEDNGLAIHTPDSARHGYKSITEVVSGFDCTVDHAETTDVEKIYDLTNKAIDSIKQTNKPAFLHLKYYRYLSHVGVDEDFEAGYRSRKEYQKWLKADPITLQRKKLQDIGCHNQQIIELEHTIDQQIDKSVQLAKDAPFPGQDELYREVWA